MRWYEYFLCGERKNVPNRAKPSRIVHFIFLFLCFTQWYNNLFWRDWMPQNLLSVCYKHCMKMNFTAKLIKSFLTCYSILVDVNILSLDDVTNYIRPTLKPMKSTLVYITLKYVHRWIGLHMVKCKPLGSTVQRSLNDWNSTPRLATPWTLAGSDLNSRELLRYNYWQDRNSYIYPTDSKRSCMMAV